MIERIDYLGLFTQEYDVFKITIDGIGGMTDLNSVVETATVSVNTNASECACDIDSYSEETEEGCLGDVSFTVTVSFEGLREHPQNTTGEGDGNPQFDEDIMGDTRPFAMHTFGNGGFSAPRPMSWDDDVDGDGERKGKGGQTSFSVSGSLSCSGDTVSGTIHIGNGLITASTPIPIPGGSFPLPGIKMYEVNYTVSAAFCGEVTEESATLSAAGFHPATNPNSSHRPPRPQP